MHSRQHRRMKGNEMLNKSAADLQRYIDDLSLANRNYAVMAVRYLGVEDEKYEAFKHDSNSIAVIMGWLMYLKTQVEE